MMDEHAAPPVNCIVTACMPDSECGVQVKSYAESLSRIGESKYRVRLRVSDGGEFLEFDFSVEGDEIRTVLWPTEFSTHVNHNFGPVRHLLEAILALDRSQCGPVVLNETNVFVP